MHTRLLTEADAARYLSVSRGYLRKARMTGDIGQHRPGPKYIRAGAMIRYDLGDLDAWIADNKVPCLTAEGGR